MNKWNNMSSQYCTLLKLDLKDVKIKNKWRIDYKFKECLLLVIIASSFTVWVPLHGGRKEKANTKFLT